MGPLAYLAMFGWIPLVLYFFMRFPPQRAVIISFIGAWLFLPLAEIPLPGLPDYTKMSATCYGILLATLLFDPKVITTFVPSWIDIPMIIWCLCPFASSITNGLGPYDGATAVLAQIVTWGIPYFLGRVYLNDLAALRQLGISIFIGGLVYVPLCLFELRMSPNLHRWIYGFTPNADFSQAIRYGGYRPTVFMSHGLMVGAWMMGASLMGIWLWKTGTIKKVWNIPMNWLVPVLLITTVLCKSTGAILLLVMGVAFLFIGRWLGTALPVFLLVLGISSYLYVGVTGTFSGDQIVAVVNQALGEDRSGSLKFRFDNEEILSAKARYRMLFGWGGWGRNRVYDEDGKDISTTDSLWIIAFGINGVVGLASVTAVLLLPAVTLFVSRYPASTWSHRKVAPIAVLAIALVLYMLDCILNAMVNPIFALTSGGLSGLLMQQETKTNQLTGAGSSTARRALVQARQK